MTTTWDQLKSWIEGEPAKIENFVKTEEGLVLAYLTPLADQIISTIKTQGASDFAAAFKVFTDAAKSAVEAGAAVIPADIASGSPAPSIAAAEAAFISTGLTEGKTDLSNAESGLIKATVAISQTGQTPPVPTTDTSAN
jgi:hypothetical protein